MSIYSSHSRLASNTTAWMVLFPPQGGDNDNAENPLPQNGLLNRFRALSEQDQEKFLQMGCEALQLQQATIEAQQASVHRLNQSIKAHLDQSLQENIKSQPEKIKQLFKNIKYYLDEIPNVCSQEQGEAYEKKVQDTFKEIDVTITEPAAKYYANAKLIQKVDLELHYAECKQLDFQKKELQLLVEIKQKEIALFKGTSTGDETATAPTEEVDNDPQRKEGLQNEIEQLKIKLRDLQCEPPAGIVEVVSWESIEKIVSDTKGTEKNKELARIRVLRRIWLEEGCPLRKETVAECKKLKETLAALDKKLVEIQSSRAVSASMQENVEYVVLKSLQEVRKAAQRVYNVLPGPVITTFSGTTAVMLAPFFFRYFHSPS